MNGYQSVINVWRESLEAKDVEIQTGTKVTKILWQNSDGKVIVTTEDGETYEADHVIITVSLGIFNRLYNIFNSAVSIKIQPVSKVGTIIEHLNSIHCL